MQALGRWLQQLIDNDRRRLMHFSISAIVFFIGYWSLHWISDNVPPSLDQELSALGLLLLTALAFAWAMAMQILHIIAKIRK